MKSVMPKFRIPKSDKFRNIVVYLLIIFFVKNVYGGGGLISVNNAKFGKTYYLGISGSEITIDGVKWPKFLSDNDISAMVQTIKRYNKQEINAISISGIASIKRANESIQTMLKSMKAEDRFVFHFSGGSIEKILDEKNNISECRFYFNAKPGENSEYFTLYNLKRWLDIIPAREQIVILDGGDTKLLKKQLVSILFDTDPNKIIVEGRKREIICNKGWGFELASAKMGALTYSILIYIRDLKQNKNDTTEVDKWNFAFSSILYGGIGGAEFEFKTQLFIYDSLRTSQKMIVIREWEIAEILSGYKIKLTPEINTDTLEINRSGENIRPKPINTSSKKSMAPKSYAFIVGMDNYQFQTPLKNPVFDAMALKKILEKKYNYLVKLITNCTSDQYYDSLNRFLSSVQFQPHDQLLVYFAGHGVYKDNWVSGAIAFVDALPSSKNPGLNNHLQHVNLINQMRSIKCNNMMVILDVCFGGSASESANLDQSSDACLNSNIDSLTWESNLLKKDKLKWFKNLDCQNRVFLTSGGNEYVPDGTPGAHSPFSAALLNALENNTSRVFRATDLVSNLKDYLEDPDKTFVKAPAPSSGRFGLNSTTTDYVFLKIVD